MTDQAASEAHPFTEAESVIMLNAKAWARLLEMIDNPPPRNQKFLEAQAWYQAVKEQSSKMEKSIIGHVTPADGNVFLDLGFPPDVAAAMLAESNESIRLKILAKSKKPSKSDEPGGGPSSEELLGQVQANAAKPKGRVRAKPKLST